MKRLLPLVILAVVCIGAYAAGEGEPESGGPVVTPAGQFPIVSEPVELKVFQGGPDWIEDFETNYLTLWLEEQLGVTHDFEVVVGEDVQQLTSLKLASQSDMPDMFNGYLGISGDAVKVYGADGAIMPLNDMIDEYGIHTRRFFEYDPNAAPQLAAVDGNIYGLPRYLESYHVSLGQRAFINKTWLDNLGLDVPQTTEDFYEVLTAFKEEDANGNGDPNDEVPFSQTNQWQGNMEGLLMNPFIYSGVGWATNQRYMVDSGTVVATFMTDEYREGLKFANRLYAEGLIDIEAFTTRGAQLKALVEHNDGNKLGGAASGSYAPFTELTGERKLDFVGLPPLEGPTGLRQTPRYPTSVQPNQFFIPVQSRYPEVAFRWADFLMKMGHDVNGNLIQEEFFERQHVFGEPGVDVLVIGMEEFPGGPGLRTPEAWYQQIRELQGVPNNKYWNTAHPLIQTRFAGHDSRVAPAEGEWNHLAALYDVADAYGPYAVETWVPPLTLTAEEIRSFADVGTPIDEAVGEAYALFVTGQLDPNSDADWDQFRRQLQNLGVNQHVELMQTVYDRQYK